MPDTGIIGGIIKLKAGGVTRAAKGAFKYNLGYPKLESIVGADAVHGPKSTVQVAYIEGEITDSYDLDLADFVRQREITVILELANGKSIILRDAYYASEGEGNTEEGNIPVRWESKFQAEEIR